MSGIQIFLQTNLSVFSLFSQWVCFPGLVPVAFFSVRTKSSCCILLSGQCLTIFISVVGFGMFTLVKC